MLISVHFPKAAGTTLKEVLQAHFRDHLCIDYNGDPLSNLDASGNVTHDIPSGEISQEIKAIHGHFHPSRYAHIADADFITFLRQPVDNLISIYFFWKAIDIQGHPLYERFKRDNPSILEFANYPAISRLMSQTYYGGVDLRRFAFIGFHESREDDLKRLAERLDIDVDIEHRTNVTGDLLSSELRAQRQEIMSDSDLRQTLTDILTEDVRFYDAARSQF